MVCAKPMIGITMGDAFGVGPEVLLSAMAENKIAEVCNPIIIGDYNILKYVNGVIKSSYELKKIFDIGEAKFESRIINVIDLANMNIEQFKKGIKSSIFCEALLESTEKAISLVMANKIDAIIGCPYLNETVNLARSEVEVYDYPSYVAKILDQQVFLMLLNGDLRVCNITLHVPMRVACDLITREVVLKTIKIVNDTVQELGVPKPNLAVSSLNAHAGNTGSYGWEEIEEIEPAIKEARNLGINVTGPLSGDDFLKDILAEKHNAYIGMYHDQTYSVLKLFKNKNLYSGLILGAPIIFAIAGQGSGLDSPFRNIVFSRTLTQTIESVLKLLKTR